MSIQKGKKMAPARNGTKGLLWIGGAIAVCVLVSAYLFQQAKEDCQLPAVKADLEKKIDFQYQIIREDISEIKEDIKIINSKLK